MARNDLILYTVLSQTADRDAAIECTREVLATAKGRKGTVDEVVARIMRDVRWVEAQR